MKILYLSSTFPLVSENFIFYEISGLLGKQAEIKILSLYRPNPDLKSDVPNQLGFAKDITYVDTGNQNRITRLYIIAKALLKLIGSGKLASAKRLLFDAKTKAEYSRAKLVNIAEQIKEANHNSEILFCHFGPMGRLAAILKYYGLIDMKIVTSFHGYDISSYVDQQGNNIYDVLFEKGDLFICVSCYFLDRIKKLGAPENKSYVVHTAIDCNKFQFKPRNITNKKIIKLVCVGRMTEKKGHVYLIEAFSMLLKSSSNYQFELHLIGQGEEYENIIKLCEDFKIRDFVIFHGALQHHKVQECLEQSDIFVLPSTTAKNGDMEGIPGSIMEAMASGLPVVTTAHAGIPELVIDGENGLIANEKDAQDLYQKISQLIVNKDEWGKLTKNAREAVVRDFERGQETEKLYKLLSKL